jgi:hypothetical protein
MNKQELIEKCEQSIQDEDQYFQSAYPWAKVVPPVKEDKYQGGVLNPWWEVKNDLGEVLFVKGIIKDDDRFPDGVDVRTSYVVDLNYDEGTQTGQVWTRNTVYTLGKKL